MAERLAKADCGNAGWRRDRAMSHERIGDLEVRRGRDFEAIAAFERALQIYRDLQARAPSDVPTRVFSVVSLWRLGGLKGREGRGDLEEALAILKELAAADRLDARRKGWIGQIEGELTALVAAR